MNQYNTNKLDIRPQLPNLDLGDSMTPDEKFQNETLRPILKLQHEIIILMVKEYFAVKKNAFFKLSAEKQPGYIKNNLLADKMISHELRGIVIGQFTSDETEYYLSNKVSIKKRIQSLLLQRISSFALPEN